MTYYSEVLEGIESGAAWTLDYKWYLPYILTTVAFFKPQSRVCVIGVYYVECRAQQMRHAYRGRNLDSVRKISEPAISVPGVFRQLIPQHRA